MPYRACKRRYHYVALIKTESNIAHIRIVSSIVHHLNAAETMSDPEQPQPVNDAPPTPQEDDTQVEVSTNYKLNATSTEEATPPTLRPIKAICEDFSLTSASASGVRLLNHDRKREFKIYDQPNVQLIFEEVEDRNEGDEEARYGEANRGIKIRIKQARDTSYGLQFLRATYSLIAVFVGGFLLIMGICILLFVYIDLAIQVNVWVSIFHCSKKSVHI